MNTKAVLTLGNTDDSTVMREFYKACKKNERNAEKVANAMNIRFRFKIVQIETDPETIKMLRVGSLTKVYEIQQDGKIGRRL